MESRILTYCFNISNCCELWAVYPMTAFWKWKWLSNLNILKKNGQSLYYWWQGMKWKPQIHLLKEVTEYTYKSLYFSNFDSMFLLEHAKKTATKNIKGKKKSLWKTASLSTETLLKRIKAGSMNFPLFFTSFSNISSLTELMNNCLLSQNIFFQICALKIAFFWTDSSSSCSSLSAATSFLISIILHFFPGIV